MRVFAMMAAAVFAAGLTVTGASAQQNLTISAPGQRGTCYGDGCPGQQRQMHRGNNNVRMPFTQQNVGGRQAVIMPGGQNRHAGRGVPRCNPGDRLGADGMCHRGGALPNEQFMSGRQGGRGVMPPQGGNAQSNPKKEKFLAGCAEYGAPVTDMGRGVKNCRVDSRVETYIDGDRVE